MDPVDVVTEIEIARSVHEVAAFAANPDNAPRWYSNIRSVEWLTPPPLIVGSRIAFVASFLGRTLRYTYEILDYTHSQQLIMQASDGPFPMRTTYIWTPRSTTHTHMMLRNEGGPPGYPNFLRPFFVTAIRSANRKDLARLKHICEAEDWPHADLL